MFPHSLSTACFILLATNVKVRCQEDTNYIENPSFPSIDDHDFKTVRLRVSQGLYVDKSLLIEELLRTKEDRLFLLTRPHKFGKTLNLNMLKRFFELNWDNKADLQANNGLFVGGEIQVDGTSRKLEPLQIAKNEDIINEYQGKYPVVSFTFTDISGRNHEDMENSVRERILDLFHGDYGSLLKTLINPDNALLDDSSKEKLKNYLERKIDYTGMLDGLLFLTKVLKLHFNKNVIVLVDDYDFAINEAFAMHGGKSKDFKFIHDTTITLLSRTVKNNPNIERAVVAGIIPLSKGDNAGLNTVSGFSVLDKKFAKYFGFTPEEVRDLLYLAPIESTGGEIKEWYNGFSFGGHPIYSPVSVMECLRHRGVLKNYRFTPGSLEILDEISTSSINVAKLQELLQNEHVLANIHTAFAYSGTADDLDIFGYLLFNGYLKAVHVDPKQDLYQISISNIESQMVLKNRISRWIETKLDIDSNKCYKTLFDSLLRCDIGEFQVTLEYILSRANFKHLYAGAEVHYAALLAGLISRNVGNDCSVRYNQLLFLEGRVDIALVPSSLERPMAIIMVIKMSERDSPCLLKRTATLALQEIYTNFDDGKVKINEHVKYVLKLGIGYSKKSVAIKYQLEKRVLNERKEIEWIKVTGVQSYESAENEIDKPKVVGEATKPSQAIPAAIPAAIVPLNTKEFISHLHTILPAKNVTTYIQLEKALEECQANKISLMEYLQSRPKEDSFKPAIRSMLSAVISKEVTMGMAYMVTTENKTVKFHNSRVENVIIDVIRQRYPEARIGDVMDGIKKYFEYCRKSLYDSTRNRTSKPQDAMTAETFSLTSLVTTQST